MLNKYTQTKASWLTRMLIIGIMLVVMPSFAISQSVSINIPYGFTPNSSWNPWVHNFADPIPAGATLTGTKLTFSGRDQGWGGSGGWAQFYVADTHVGGVQLWHHTTSNTINSENCFSTYQYGSSNTLKMYFYGYPGWQGFFYGGTLTLYYEFVTPLEISSSSSTNVSCNGAANGSIQISHTGGRQPVSVLWSNGATSNNLSGLAPGEYTAIITDFCGNSVDQTFTITEPSTLLASATASSILCFGGISDIDLTVTGGTSPYSIAWSNTSTSEDLSSVSAGSYSATVTDANGCSVFVAVEISQPDQLIIDAGENQMVFLGYAPTESANLLGMVATGGIEPYTYEWSLVGGGSEGSGLLLTVSPIESVNYLLTVTDGNGCVASDEVSVCVVDIAVPGKKGKSSKKVYLCHVPEDNPSNEHTIAVSVNAVPDHLAHGDKLGPCGTPQSCDDTFKSGVSDAFVNLPQVVEDYLKVYPNPAQGDVFVEFSLDSGVHTKVSIFDITGSTHEILFDNTADKNQESRIKIETQSLSKGIYFIKKQTSTGLSETVKLIVH